MIYEKAFAKVNLNLYILGKRNDGYHELKSLVIPTSFYDELIFEYSDENIIKSDVVIKDNLILKTVELFQKVFQTNRKVSIKLKKNIPIGSGLGGGSADAAATLRGLNKLYNLNLSLKELEPLANKLGSDVLFCLYNEPAIISGRGDIIEFIEGPQINELALIILDLKVLTKDVFDNHILIQKGRKEIDYLNDLHNDLLLTLMKIDDTFLEIYNDLSSKFGNIYMTGSGPTLFIVNPSNEVKAKLNQLETKDVYLKKLKIIYTN